MKFITVALSESIGTITLNHDRKRNALSRGLIKEVIKALNDLVYQTGPGDCAPGQRRRQGLVRGP